MQYRQESAARQGMDLFLWPCVLGQQDSRGILTSSALRIKRWYRHAGRAKKGAYIQTCKMHKSVWASYKMPSSLAMRRIFKRLYINIHVCMDV